jgi:hypothetical protein
MFISDLNTIETVEVSAVVGGTFTIPTPTPAPSPTKNIVTNTTVNQAYNVNIALIKNAAVNSALNSAVNVTGNASTIVFDNTALGGATYTQSDLSNIVIAGQLSEGSGTLIAAAK